MYDGVGPCKFVFSSVVASLGNGGIRAVIFIRRLGCLTVEKPISITNLYTPFFILRLGCLTVEKPICITNLYTLFFIRRLGCVNV